MTDRGQRQQILREAIGEARVARREDSRRCQCGHLLSGHLVRLSDGAAFHCCDEECGCNQYTEVPAQETP